MTPMRGGVSRGDLTGAVGGRVWAESSGNGVDGWSIGKEGGKRREKKIKDPIKFIGFWN